MNKSEIHMIHGTEYKNMTKTLLEEACLKEHIPNPHDCIGIKPNLVCAAEASWGATTHPEVVAGIIEYLQENGFTNLMMLEGSWVGDSTEDAKEVCGYNALSEHYGVPFFDTQKDSYTKKDCMGMDLFICDVMEQVDFLINVPVMKGHCQTKITCALKNMKGLIPNQEKRHFHSMGLHKPIAHLNTGIKQDFIVVDNICGDLDFEDGGNPVEMNRVWACVDPVLCDAYVCQQLQYSVEDVPYISIAEQLGIGSTDLNNLSIHHCRETKHDLAIPIPNKVVEVQDAVEAVDSCSACYGYLLPALYRLKEEGLYDNIPHKICIGQGYRGKSGVIGIGNCTRNFQYSLNGCPPVEEDVYEFLKNIIEEGKGN